MLPIPEKALETHTAIVGKTGSGKSNLAKVIAESLMDSGERVCIVDPTSTWWGIRLNNSGKKQSGFKPIIFGGPHGDIQISREHGAAMAEAIGTSSDSAIIDTREMTVGARTMFFTDFAEGLLRTNRGALTLIIDEAHLFMPQGRVNDPQSGKMVNAGNNLISLGRGIGLRIIMISQRPAKIHKDSLTQIETLVAMRLIAPQDIKAINDWIGEWAGSDGKEILRSLPSLSTGMAWVWAPEIDFLKQTKVPLASTFDTGNVSTQNRDTKLDPLDVDEISNRLEKIRHDVIDNDPKRLKQKVARLEAQLKKSGASETDLQNAENTGFQKGYRKGRQDSGRMVLEMVQNFVLKNDEARAPGASPRQTVEAGIGSLPPQARKEPGADIHRASSEPAAISPSAEKIVHQIISVYPRGLTLQTAAKRAGLSARSSAFRQHKISAAADPRICDRGDGSFVAVEGVAVSGDTIPAGLDAFKARLPGSFARMLTVIENANGEPVTADEIAVNAEVSRTSSGLSSGLRELVALELVVKTPDGWKLHSDFLEDA